MAHDRSFGWGRSGRAPNDPTSSLELARARQEFLDIPALVPQPFVPDHGQREALAAIQERDTLLIAPTGYGKSWVAYEAARLIFEAGGLAYYTTPLKALSNQKYTDLRTLLGTAAVGLVTGDRQENPQAPVLVMTTEILRNMLAEGRPITRDGSPCLVILDECHWMADPERGTTWEEIVLLAPPAVRLLLLSASVGNGSEIAGWIHQARGQDPRVITVDQRPVPQRWGILDARLDLVPLDFALAHPVRFLVDPPLPRVAAVLAAYGLTPALVFLPTRRACDVAAAACAASGVCAGLVARVHHAGRALRERLEVEEALRDGAVDVIFCTTTLASGIDAPVKTVVLGSLEDGQGRALVPTVIQQMAGRAGRRGRDPVGFVIGLPTGVADLAMLREVRERPPAPVDSAFVPTYQTTLLLATRLGTAGVREFAARSLARYQKGGLIAATQAQIVECQDALERLWDDLRPRACDDPATTWPRFLEERRRRAKERRERRQRLADGFLCSQGIAFARDEKGKGGFLVLTPDGEIAPAPDELAPDSVHVRTDVQEIIRRLLEETHRDPAPVPGRWYRLGVRRGRRSIRRVVGVIGRRIHFDIGKPVPLARWAGLDHAALQPERLAHRVRALVERREPAPSPSLGEHPHSVPCPTCPALAACEKAQRRSAVLRTRLRRAVEAARAIDPVARVEATLEVLRRLGAYDPRTLAPTALGRALLATHDPAGLFFALQRRALAALAPRTLAMVVGATRDVRTGAVRLDHRVLPAWYARAVITAARAEERAGGFHTLQPLVEDVRDFLTATPGGEHGAVRRFHRERLAPPGFAERRARVIALLWDGTFPAEEEMAPGDVERLLLSTVDALRELRDVPELGESASIAYEHLRRIAESFGLV